MATIPLFKTLGWINGTTACFPRRLLPQQPEQPKLRLSGTHYYCLALRFILVYNRATPNPTGGLPSYASKSFCLQTNVHITHIHTQSGSETLRLYLVLIGNMTH